MPIALAIAISIVIPLGLYLSIEKFILPNRLVKFSCFFSLFVVQFLFMLFFPETPGISELAILFCGIVMSFFIYTRSKNYLKSIDLVLSVILVFTIYLYIISSIMHFVLPVFLSLEENIKEIVYRLIIQTFIIALGFLLRKYKDYFFSQTENEKLMKFYIVLKILLFILLCFVMPLLFLDFIDLHYLVALSVTAIIVINFCIYIAKLITELRNENRISAIALSKLQIEAKNINTRYEEIIKFKHYYTSLYKSLIFYIREKDLPGLEDYYNKNISPIHEQLSKEIEDYDQIKQIHITTLKARIVELINTVSQIQNVEFFLHMTSDVYSVKMSEIDLYKVITILIDNALEEAINHKKGVIRIEMGQTHKSFYFQIKNTIKSFKSTPKPYNTHKGLLLVMEIKKNYSNMNFFTEKEYGYFVQYVVVSND